MFLSPKPHSLMSPLLCGMNVVLPMPVYGCVFLLTELAHSFKRTNCSALKQELAGF